MPEQKENYKESPTFPNDQNTFWYNVENAVLPGRKIITGQMRILQGNYDMRDILDHLSCDNACLKGPGRKSRSGKPLVLHDCQDMACISRQIFTLSLSNDDA